MSSVVKHHVWQLGLPVFRGWANQHLSKVLLPRNIKHLHSERVKCLSQQIVHFSTGDQGSQYGSDHGEVDLNPSRKAQHKITQPVNAANVAKSQEKFRQRLKESAEIQEAEKNRDNSRDEVHTRGPDMVAFNYENRMRNSWTAGNQNWRRTERLYNHGLPGPGKTDWKRWSNKNAPVVKGEILYGAFPILLALREGRRQPHSLYIKKSLVNSGRPLVLEILQLVSEHGIDVKECDARMLDTLSQSRPHQGVCLDTESLQYSGLVEDKELGNVIRPVPQLWLLIDSIQDPMNYGAILRSSYFLGVDKVFTVHSGSCGLTPVVSKASAGAMEVMNVHLIKNQILFLKEKKLSGWRIMGTVSEDPKGQKVTPLQKVTLCGNTILLLGNEGVGMKQEVIDMCDELVAIAPGNRLSQGIDSLNVSVATGIILYHLLSSRTDLDTPSAEGRR